MLLKKNIFYIFFVVITAIVSKKDKQSKQKKENPRVLIASILNCVSLKKPKPFSCR